MLQPDSLRVLGVPEEAVAVSDPTAGPRLASAPFALSHEACCCSKRQLGQGSIHGAPP